MTENLAEQKFKRMTTEPYDKLIWSMAIPSIVSMLISAFYNLADTFFVGKISTQATGAVGVVFSYMTLVQAISFFFGHGSGNFISRALGKKDRESAVLMASTGFFSAIIVGMVLGGTGLFFVDPVLRFLGSTETILPEARKYFRCILIATPFIMGSFVLNNQMRLQGNARIGMIGIMSGAILNLALDPLFIFVFDMGVTGAAVATGISQFVGFSVLLFLCGKKDGICIRFKNFKPNGSRLYEIFAGGVPSLARQGLMSVATICLNNVAGGYSDEAIAALSIVTRITFIANSTLIGFGHGFQPVCGFNFGAGLYERVKKAFWYCVKYGTIIMTVFGVIGFSFAPYIVREFRNDHEVIRIAVKALKYQCVSMPLLGLSVLGNMYLQNTRRTVSATITAMSRQGVIFIPALYLLSYIWGLNGVLCTQPVADVIAFLITIPFILKYINKND